GRAPERGIAETQAAVVQYRDQRVDIRVVAGRLVVLALELFRVERAEERGRLVQVAGGLAKLVLQHGVFGDLHHAVDADVVGAFSEVDVDAIKRGVRSRNAGH